MSRRHRPSSSLLRAAVILAALAATPLAATAEPVFPKGSRVGLEVPSTLKLMPGAPRFVDEDRKAVMIVLDLPGAAFPEFQSKLFDAKDETGVTVEKREPFAIAGGLAYLMTMRLDQNGEKIRKWVLLSSSSTQSINNLTALVSLDVPEAAKDFYTEQKIRDMLATVVFRTIPVEEQLSVLPYRIGDLAGFRVVQTTPPAGVVLTEGPNDRTLSQPGMIIALFPQQPPDQQDRANFALELLRSFGLPELRVTNSETLRLKGQQTYEVRAEAKDPQSGGKLNIVQWVRFGQEGFTRIIGTSPAAMWNDSYTRFRTVRDSLAFREPGDAN